MLFDQLLGKVQIQQYRVKDLLVREIALKALLNVLKVSDHTGIVVNGQECLCLLQFIDNHHFVRLLLELYLGIIVTFSSRERVIYRLIGGGEHKLALMGCVGENALRHATAVGVTVEEELVR